MNKTAEADIFFRAHSQWLAKTWSMIPEGREYIAIFDRHVEEAFAPEKAPKYAQPHQQRVYEEAADLCAKHNALTPFMGTTMFASLDSAEQSRLIRQHGFQAQLINVLNERIAAFY